MNEKLRQQFDEQLTYLPEINQQALKSFDWATELIGIGKNYGLHIDELEDLQLETMLVLVGLVSPDEYPNELMVRLAISPAEANKIIAEINKRIFIPIHDYILRGENPTPVAEPTPAGTMESVGFQMTTEDVPTPMPTVTPVRTGGGTPQSQLIPDGRPSPLQFHPNPTESTIPEAPVPTSAPVAPTPSLQLSREKLEKMIQDRQKTVDATIASMGQ